MKPSSTEESSSDATQEVKQEAKGYLVNRAVELLINIQTKLDFQQFVIDDLAKRVIHWHPVFNAFPTQVMNIVYDFVKELQSNQALLEDLEKAGMSIDEFIASEQVNSALELQEVNLFREHQKDGRQDYSNRLSKMSLEQLITFALVGGCTKNEHLINSQTSLVA